MASQNAGWTFGGFQAQQQPYVDLLHRAYMELMRGLVRPTERSQECACCGAQCCVQDKSMCCLHTWYIRHTICMYNCIPKYNNPTAWSRQLPTSTPRHINRLIMLLLLIRKWHEVGVPTPFSENERGWGTQQISGAARAYLNPPPNIFLITRRRYAHGLRTTLAWTFASFLARVWRPNTAHRQKRDCTGRPLLSDNHVGVPTTCYPPSPILYTFCTLFAPLAEIYYFPTLLCPLPPLKTSPSKLPSTSHPCKTSTAYFDGLAGYPTGLKNFRDSPHTNQAGPLGGVLPVAQTDPTSRHPKISGRRCKRHRTSNPWVATPNCFGSSPTFGPRPVVPVVPWIPLLRATASNYLTAVCC